VMAGATVRGGPGGVKYPAKPIKRGGSNRTCATHQRAAVGIAKR
jgi:hypothetical protein